MPSAKGREYFARLQKFDTRKLGTRGSARKTSRSVGLLVKGCRLSASAVCACFSQYRPVRLPTGSSAGRLTLLLCKSEVAGVLALVCMLVI